MCYDISFKVEIRQLSDYFPDLIFDSQIQINFDVTVHIIGHDYGEHPIIYKNRADGLLHCRLMEWGCIPYYVKDESQYKRQRASMLNARSERILDDANSYWYKIRNRRCLIPVNGTYEHRGIKGWKNKVPYFVKLKNQEMFFLPGLYSVAEIADKETGEIVKRYTYTLITRDANDIMKKIHNDGENRWRMPLFLPFDLAMKWVTEDDLSIEDYRSILNYEIPSEELDYWPVFTIRGRKPRADNKMKDEYYEWPKLPELGVGDPEPIMDPN